ncbi:efflux RND transporter permease subunit [Anaerobacillus sp. HL2]|nr:efflux RND transporter permease subunit [Anaerobacillus sp. HL2]
MFNQYLNVVKWCCIVSIEGRRKDEEIQVLLDQAKLASYNVSSSQVIQAIGSENRAASASNLTREIKNYSCRSMAIYDIERYRRNTNSFK